MTQVHAVILSGGSGTRLWPQSRQAHPKPFMLCDGERSFLQATITRVAGCCQSIRIVTNQDYFFQTRRQFLQVQPAGELLCLLEPSARNTAGAAILAALSLQAEGRGAEAMLILPADHLIRDEATFTQDVQAAAKLASEGWLLTFGIKPAYAETGFGYIQQGQPLAGQAFQVQRFTEKPDAQTAARFVASGEYWWNAGIFCVTADTLLAQCQLHAPELLSACRQVWQGADQTLSGAVSFEAESFALIPSTSIDYAICEKSDRIAVLAANFDWSDIGSWSAMRSLHQADARGNHFLADVINVDCDDCYIESERLVAGIGLQGLVVVDTPDALLICDESRSQDVKLVVEQLKQREHDSYRLHNTVHRPWGSYTVLEEGTGYKIKRIEVTPGASLSLQMHYHRSEHWIVVSGTARVTNGDDVLTLQANQSTYIPAEHKHRLENPGQDLLVMIEVQSGSYLGEDDIVRFEDKYGRG